MNRRLAMALSLLSLVLLWLTFQLLVGMGDVSVDSEENAVVRPLREVSRKEQYKSRKETDSPRVSLDGEGDARIRLLTHDGKPVSGASVALCRSSAKVVDFASLRIPRAVTNEEGEASFDAEGDAEGDVYIVMIRGSLPLRFEALSGARPQVLRGPIPSFTGRVFVSPPGSLDSVPLSLHGFADPSRDWCDMAREFIRNRWAEPRVDLSLDPDGRFAVMGLPVDSAELRLDSPFVFKKGLGKKLPLRLPRQGMRIDLLQGQTIRCSTRSERWTGRLHDAELYVRYSLSYDRRGQKHGRIQTRLGKTFEIAQDTGGATKVRFEVRDALDDLVLAFREDPLPDGPAIDLPALEIDRLEMLRFRIIDSLGRPIRGALVINGDRISEAADKRGICEILGVPRSQVYAVAKGHDPTRIELPERPLREILVQMSSSTGLRIHVRSMDGAKLPGLVVVTTWSRSLRPRSFEKHSQREDWFSTRSSGGYASASAYQAEGSPLTISYSGLTNYYDLPSSGTLVLQGLAMRSGKPGSTQPSAKIELRLEDAYSHHVTGGSFQLEPGRIKDVELTLPMRPRDIVGVVIGEGGKPILHARVKLGENFGPDAKNVDKQGRFSFVGVCSQSPSLDIEAKGYVSESFDTDAVYDRREYTLQRGRQLWIEVLDASNERVECSLVLRQGKRSFGAMRRSTGFFELMSVPLTPLKAIVNVKGKKHTLPVPSSGKNVTLRL